MNEIKIRKKGHPAFYPAEVGMLILLRRLDYPRFSGLARAFSSRFGGGPRRTAARCAASGASRETITPRAVRVLQLPPTAALVKGRAARPCRRRIAVALAARYGAEAAALAALPASLAHYLPALSAAHSPPGTRPGCPLLSPGRGCRGRAAARQQPAPAVPPSAPGASAAGAPRLALRQRDWRDE